MPEHLTATLKALGAAGDRVEITPDALAERLLGGAEADLANGWQLRVRRVANEPRIELLGPDFAAMRELEADGGLRRGPRLPHPVFRPDGRAGSGRPPGGHRAPARGRGPGVSPGRPGPPAPRPRRRGRPADTRGDPGTRPEVALRPPLRDPCRDPCPAPATSATAATACSAGASPNRTTSPTSKRRTRRATRPAWTTGYSERPMTEWVYRTGSHAAWGAAEKRLVHHMTPARVRRAHLAAPPRECRGLPPVVRAPVRSRPRGVPRGLRRRRRGPAVGLGRPPRPTRRRRPRSMRASPSKETPPSPRSHGTASPRPAPRWRSPPARWPTTTGSRSDPLARRCGLVALAARRPGGPVATARPAPGWRHRHTGGGPDPDDPLRSLARLPRRRPRHPRRNARPPPPTSARARSPARPGAGAPTRATAPG